MSIIICACGQQVEHVTALLEHWHKAHPEWPCSTPKVIDLTCYKPDDNITSYEPAAWPISVYEPKEGEP